MDEVKCRASLSVIATVGVCFAGAALPSVSALHTLLCAVDAQQFRQFALMLAPL
jgi:hypothetical protein